MNLKEGNIYHVESYRNIPIGYAFNRMFVYYLPIDDSGEYEYIGKNSRYFHFFSNEKGKDILLTKREVEQKVSELEPEHK